MKLLLLTFFAIIFLVTSSSRENVNTEDALFVQLADKLSKSFGNEITNEQVDAVLNAIKNELPELKLGEPTGDAQKYLQNRELANQCYEPKINGTEVNIFFLPKTEVMKKYFNYHGTDLLENGNLETYLKRVKGLYETIDYIAKETLECVNKVKAEKNFEPTKIGFTSMSSYTHEEFLARFTLDYSILDKEKKVFKQNNLTKKYPFKVTRCETNSIESLPDEFDWRTVPFPNGLDYSVVTPVKSQGHCGSCYIFAATAAMETNFMRSKKNKRKNQTLFSEQALLNCAKKGCKGGQPSYVFKEASKMGLTDSWRLKYQGHNNTCNTSFPVVSRPTGYCLLSGVKGEIPDDETIQKVVLKYGPAVMRICSKNEHFQHLRGPYNWDCKNNTPSHAITTVGWNEQYFIAKNSWGPEFGVDGYLYLKKDGKKRCAFRFEMVVPSFDKDNVKS